jgi:hypothetical protein
LKRCEFTVENIARNAGGGYIQTGLKRKRYALSVIKNLGQKE